MSRRPYGESEERLQRFAQRVQSQSAEGPAGTTTWISPAARWIGRNRNFLLFVCGIFVVGELVQVKTRGSETAKGKTGKH